MEGESAIPSAVRDMAPFLEGVRATDDANLKGGVGDNGSRAYNAIVRACHGASLGEGEGR